MADSIRRPDPFGISREALAGSSAEAAPGGREKDIWQSIAPIPDDVPPPRLAIARHGEPEAVYRYRDTDGRLLCLSRRFAAPGPKALPLTWCEGSGGKREWRSKALPVPRPLYGLQPLAERLAAPVLVVEGEKTADAAAALFHEYIVVTSPNGARAADKADWLPLRGRSVIIWPDQDADGRSYADAVARAASAAGASEVSIVAVPPTFPQSWDLADPPPDGVTQEQLADLLKQARPVEPAPIAPAKNEGTQRYEHRSDGLWLNEAGKVAIHVAGPFRVVAQTRNAENGNWGLCLEWADRDGKQHIWVMPRAALAGDGVEVFRKFLSHGLYVAPSRAARMALLEYLADHDCEERQTVVERIGWHGTAFVLPDEQFGEVHGESLVLHLGDAPPNPFRQAGTLAVWQAGVAALCRGNSRLEFALSAALAGPLLHLTGGEAGGFHLCGASSTGKTTALTASGSVWGGGGATGYLRMWRTTANGLEAVAALHNDTFLCLDEIGQIDGKEAGPVAYMMANRGGKSRAARDGSARPAAEFRVLFLSTGEISLADKIREGGGRAMAGMEMRFLDIPADANAGYGLFENLHEFPSAAEFARHLNEQSARYFGSAARAWLTFLASDPDAKTAEAKARLRTFTARHAPAGASSQVTRAAARFGLVAAAGEMAIATGILPWPAGAAMQGVGDCFHAWLAARGGLGPLEDIQAIRQVAHYFALHGSSRFQEIDDATPDGDDPEASGNVVRRAGFRRVRKGRQEYLCFREIWDSEICRGHDGKRVAELLAQRGYLLPGGDGRLTDKVRIRNTNGVRVYVVLADIQNWESDAAKLIGDGGDGGGMAD